MTERNELLKNTGDFKSFREADKIIAYLGDPDGNTTLTAKQKEKLTRYQLIHGLRMRYKDRKYIIGILKQKGRDPRQASYDISEAEYIFGTAINVSRKYELAFLLETSRKNIAIAMKSKDAKTISKALEVHYKILGPDTDLSELPDFSKFEQHNYNLVLPKEVLNVLTQLISSGALNLSEIIPPQMLQIKAKDDTKT